MAASPPPNLMNIHLRPPEPCDFEILFEFQLDPVVNELAATYPRDRRAFEDRWRSSLNDPETVFRIILADEVVAGCVTCFPVDGQRCVGYLVGREFWGRGIASQSLRLLLQEVSVRPLHAHVASHNIPSLRVLEKCGFIAIGRCHSPETERYRACEEVILELRAE